MRPAYRCLKNVTLALALLAVMAAPAAAGVHVSLQPAVSHVAPDSVFKVFIHVDEEGSEFNGYDAVILWDPEILAFVSCQPESLFSQHNQWWVPVVGDGELSISHVIMQGGVFETGPGALSSITFRADQLGDSPVVFDLAVFYRAGFLVEPVYTTDALVRVVDPTSGIPHQEHTQGIGLHVQPNPFSGSAWIRAELEAAAPAQLWLHDASGRNLGHLATGGAGSAQWPIEALTGGSPLPAGVYFLTIRSGEVSSTARVVRIR